MEFLGERFLPRGNQLQEKMSEDGIEKLSKLWFE